MTQVAAIPDGQVARVAVTFARVLRGAGLDVAVSNVVAYTDALAVVGLTEEADVYWAGRATLVRTPEDRPVYDRAFDIFFRRAGGGQFGLADEQEPESISLAVDSDDGEGDVDDEEPEEPSIELRFSTVEVLKQKDFAEYSDQELAESHHVMRRMRFAGAPRRSRRQRPSTAVARPDVARTVRAAFATGGEAIRRHHRVPSQRPRRLVLLLDISGSMDPYATALLRFVHAAVSGRQRVEAFALGTRLTRLTRELSSRDPDRALSRASEQVADWSGGTRLGDMLARFNDTWGQRGLAHGAHVVILSDGWDRGDPELLTAEMGRLHRLAHQVVWV
ncbi:MAG: VWA domain-containing protein, partial [Actinomycetota bacterium]|nr:VWA domain-containing protein [Actinomycetota bacterium]